jgi:tRNA(Ile)-lysidine synthase
MTILDRVASVIHCQNLMGENDRVIVAVSGGADSLALLHILEEIDLPLQLVAVYIDHGLRPQETGDEKKIIENCCVARQIPFESRPVDVHRLIAREKLSPEEAARILRYSALEKVRQEYSAKLIAVGHTADDQVEEFFIRLIRGSGSKGLSGMRAKNNNIVRPLLFATKTELVDYLSSRGVPWCQDSSNFDRQFLRNRVRLDLLPLLEKKFNANLRKTLLQNMDILAEEDQYLDAQTMDAYWRCVKISYSAASDRKHPQLTINNEKITSLHPAIKRRVIEKSCRDMDIRPTYERICTLIEYIEHGRNGSELHLENGVRAEKSADSVLFSRPLPKGQPRGSRRPAPSIRQLIPGTGTYQISGTNKELVLEQIPITAGEKKEQGELHIDLSRISFPLLLRSFLPGEKFHPCGGPGRKKISRYFNEQKIPEKERPAWPILFCKEKVVALVGLQLDHNCRISGNTREILAIHWRDRKS